MLPILADAIVDPVVIAAGAAKRLLPLLLVILFALVGFILGFKAVKRRKRK